MQMPFYVAESSHLFVDAFATEANGGWVFGSFWGNETELQQLIARLSLPKHEDGLTSFTLMPTGPGRPIQIDSGRVSRMSKLSARTPPSTVLGSLMNLWIFDPAIQRADKVSGKAYVVGLEGDAAIEDRIWFQIQQLCQLPILDDWRSYIMEEFKTHEWIVPLNSVGIAGYQIVMEHEAVDHIVGDGLRNGILEA